MNTRPALPENQLSGLLARVAHHRPDRVAVLSTPMPEQLPGTTAYQITGATEQDVQREVDRIMTDVGARTGVGEFRTPARSREPEYFGRWQSRGYTRITPTLVSVK